MTAARVVAPAARREGWTTIPVSCSRCRKNLPDLVLLNPDGPVRCARCHSLYYVLVHSAIHMAYIAETTAKELAMMQERQFTIAQILAYYGSSFPYTPPAA